MLQGNLVSKTACLWELQRIFDSSLVSMLASIGENFEPHLSRLQSCHQNLPDYYVPISLRMAEVSSRLSPLRDVSRGGTSATEIPY